MKDKGLEQTLLSPLHFVAYTVINANNQSDSTLETKLKQYLKYRPLKLGLYRSKSGYALGVRYDCSDSDANAYRTFYERVIKLVAKKLGLKIKSLKTKSKGLKPVYENQEIPHVAAKFQGSHDERSQWAQLVTYNIPVLVKFKLPIPKFHDIMNLAAVNVISLVHQDQDRVIDGALYKDKHGNTHIKNLKDTLLKLRKACNKAMPAARTLIMDGFVKTNRLQKAVLIAIHVYRPSINDSVFLTEPYIYPYENPDGYYRKFDASVEAQKILKIMPMYIRGSDAKSPLILYVYYNGYLHGVYSSSTDMIETGIDLMDPGLTSPQLESLLANIRRHLLANPNSVKSPITDDPYLIAFHNGLYNLKTKELKPFSPKEVVEAKLATSYNPAWEPYAKLTYPFAHCKNLPKAIKHWNPRQFIANLANHNPVRIETLYQIFLEAISTQYSRHKAIILIGPGKSGKSTMLKIIQNLIGSQNYASIPFEKFGLPFVASGLVNKVADISHETDSDTFLSGKNSGKLKAILTGDPVMVSAKFQNAYHIQFPNMFFIQAGNKLFKSHSDKGAMSRRFMLIGMNNQKISLNGNPEIRDDFINRPEFLEWLAYTVVNHVKPFKKFKESKADRELNVKQEYRNSPIKRFIKAELMPMFNDNYGKIDKITKLYAYAWYKSWCKKEGLKHEAKTRFLSDLDNDLHDVYGSKNKLPLISTRSTIKKTDTEALIRIANKDPDNKMPEPEPNDVNGGTYQRGIYYFAINNYIGKRERILEVNIQYPWPAKANKKFTNSRNEPNADLSKEYVDFKNYVLSKEFDYFKDNMTKSKCKDIQYDVNISSSSWLAIKKKNNISFSKFVQERMYEDLRGPKSIIADAFKHFKFRYIVRLPN